MSPPTAVRRSAPLLHMQQSRIPLQPLLFQEHTRCVKHIYLIHEVMHTTPLHPHSHSDSPSTRCIYDRKRNLSRPSILFPISASNLTVELLNWPFPSPLQAHSMQRQEQRSGVGRRWQSKPSYTRPSFEDLVGDLRLKLDFTSGSSCLTSASA